MAKCPKKAAAVFFVVGFETDVAAGGDRHVGRRAVARPHADVGEGWPVGTPPLVRSVGVALARGGRVVSGGQHGRIHNFPPRSPPSPPSARR